MIQRPIIGLMNVATSFESKLDMKEPPAKEEILVPTLAAISAYVDDKDFKSTSNFL